MTTRRGATSGKVIAVSGSREYKNWLFVFGVLRNESPDFIKVGDCPSGADLFTHMYAHAAKIDHEVFKADWARYGNAAGPKRNREMIDSGAEKLISFPANSSVGTKDCSVYAHSVGMSVYFPDWEMWNLIGDYEIAKIKNTWFSWAEPIINAQEG